jgi:hypothetical protein
MKYLAIIILLLLLGCSKKDVITINLDSVSFSLSAITNYLSTNGYLIIKIPDGISYETNGIYIHTNYDLVVSTNKIIYFDAYNNSYMEDITWKNSFNNFCVYKSGKKFYLHRVLFRVDRFWMKYIEQYLDEQGERKYVDGRGVSTNDDFIFITNQILNFNMLVKHPMVIDWMNYYEVKPDLDQKCFIKIKE